MDNLELSQMLYDFGEYHTEDGLFSNASNGRSGIPSQNGALFTVESMICICSQDLAIGQHIGLGPLYRSCDTAIKNLERYPGVTARLVGSVEHDSMDNGAAILCWSRSRDDGMAQRIYQHGRTVRCDGNDVMQNAEGAKKFRPLAWLIGGFRTRWFWNVSEPTKFCLQGWHGRSPGYMAMMRAAAGYRLWPHQSLALWVGQMWGVLRPSDATLDYWKLSYVGWHWLRNRNLLYKLGYKLWCRSLLKSRPEGMKAVYREYFGPRHPLAKWSKKI